MRRHHTSPKRTRTETSISAQTSSKRGPVKSEPVDRISVRTVKRRPTGDPYMLKRSLDYLTHKTEVPRTKANPTGTTASSIEIKNMANDVVEYLLIRRR